MAFDAEVIRGFVCRDERGCYAVYPALQAFHCMVWELCVGGWEIHITAAELLVSSDVRCLDPSYALTLANSAPSSVTVCTSMM